MHMLLRLAAILALSLLIASIVLVLVVEELKQRQKDSEQSSPMQGSDVRPPDAEDTHRKTLEAADAMRGKQAESFLRHQH